MGANSSTCSADTSLHEWSSAGRLVALVWALSWISQASLLHCCGALKASGALFFRSAAAAVKCARTGNREQENDDHVNELGLGLRVPAMQVIIKVAGWEVQVPTRQCDVEDVGSGNLGRSTAWVSELGSGSDPSFSSATLLTPRYVHVRHNSGLVTRLDRPTSGIMLGSDNVWGFFLLMWQMRTYTLARCYVVCSSNCLSPMVPGVSATLLEKPWLPIRAARTSGKPARTLLVVLGHLTTK